MIINSRRFARNLKVNHKIPSVSGSEVITHDDGYAIIMIPKSQYRYFICTSEDTIIVSDLYIKAQTGKNKKKPLRQQQSPLQ
jgi:hypothetical protein